MLIRNLTTRTIALGVAILGGLFLNPSPASAASQLGVTMNIFFQEVDEQNTNAYYNTTGACSGSSTSIDVPFLTGDLSNGPAFAYNFVPPWTLSTDLSSSSFANGTYCNTGTNVCLGVKFNKNLSVLSLDTRGTLGPRKVILNFSAPCLSCSIPGSTPSFGSSVSTPALMSIFLDTPYTGMSVCSSTACPEAQPAFAKLWFNDPNNSQLNWRVDWSYMRVLRMSTNTWYVIADGCDGGRVAALYRLQNQRNKVSVSLQGYYLVPFFATAAQ